MIFCVYVNKMGFWGFGVLGFWGRPVRCAHYSLQRNGMAAAASGPAWTRAGNDLPALVGVTVGSALWRRPLAR